MNFKKPLLIAGLIAAGTLIFSGCGSKVTNGNQNKDAVSYPQKTIKLISYGKAGSGPDKANRLIADMIHKKYGWKFEIVNETSNSGADAVKDVWSAPHDGYTILGQSENMFGFPVLGLTNLTAKNWSFYEAYGDQSVIAVKADSPYKTIQDLVNAAKEKPNKIKIANAGIGKSFQLKAVVLEVIAGVKFNHAAYDGSASSVKAVLDGEADAVTASTSSLTQEINNGNLRPLIITDLASFDFGGNVGRVDSITKVYPEAKNYLPMDAVIGMAMPSDVPASIRDAFSKAFEGVMNSPEMTEYLSRNNSYKVAISNDNAKGYAEAMERNYSWAIKDIGMAKVDPVDLGIEKRK